MSNNLFSQFTSSFVRQIGRNCANTAYGKVMNLSSGGNLFGISTAKQWVITIIFFLICFVGCKECISYSDKLDRDVSCERINFGEPGVLNSDEYSINVYKFDFDKDFSFSIRNSHNIYECIAKFNKEYKKKPVDLMDQKAFNKLSDKDIENIKSLMIDGKIYDFAECDTSRLFNKKLIYQRHKAINEDLQKRKELEREKNKRKEYLNEN